MIHTHDAITVLLRWPSFVQRTQLSSPSHIKLSDGEVHFSVCPNGQ